jgi:CubicO group peptidase (beta-lactamase class C family)
MATDVLGRIIELVSGVTLDTFVEKRITKPLGMESTGFYVHEPDIGRLAQPQVEPAAGERPRSDLISFYKFDSRGLSHTMSDHKDFVHLPALRRPCGATVDPQRVPAEWCELRNRNTSPHPQEHDL